MAATVKCTHCGRLASVADHALGQNVKCPYCNQSFITGAPAPPSPQSTTLPLSIPLGAGGTSPNPQPVPPSRTVLAAPDQPPIRYTCPRCRSSLESPLRMVGKKINCPRCRQRLQIPQPTVLPTPPLSMTILALDDRSGQPNYGDVFQSKIHDQRENYDDRGLTGDRKRSGVVTAIGIITIIYGSLMLLGAFWHFFSFDVSRALHGGLGGREVGRPVQLAQAVVEVEGVQVQGVLPGGFGGRGVGRPGLDFVLAATVLQGIAGLVGGATGISGGIGLLMRKRWGRILAITTVGLGILSFLLGLIAIAVAMSWPDHRTSATAIAFFVFRLLIDVGYAVFALVVLFHSKWAQEFN